MMELGLSSKAIVDRDWFKHIPTNIFEINLRVTKFYLNPHWIESILPFLKGKTLSIHSRCSMVFTGIPQFTETELSMLRSEIISARMIGADIVVFHIKNEPLTPAQEKEIDAIIGLAKSNGIKLAYESNSKADGPLGLAILKRFPNLGYNLDLGHLNCGYCQKTLMMEIDDFVKKVRDRTIYLHLHNNNGIIDEHKALREGTLDWKRVLSLLDLKKLRLISEVNTMEQHEMNVEDMNALCGVGGTSRIRGARFI